MIWNDSLERYPEIPRPMGHGWVLDEPGKLNYDRTKGDVMPQELVVQRIRVKIALNVVKASKLVQMKLIT